MFRVAVCDDEKDCRNRLKELLRIYTDRTGEMFEVIFYDSADRLLLDYPQDLDILLLDIYMNGVDGMSAAREIRKFDPAVCIIFITTMYQYALEGYSVRAFGFVRKPVQAEEFNHELDCALRQIQNLRNREKLLSVKFQNMLFRIPISEIAYGEVQNHAVYLHTADGIREYRGQLSGLEQELGPCGFFRCHASFLVNASYIRRIDSSELLLKTGETIPVSQRRRKEFLAELSMFVGDRI